MAASKYTIYNKSKNTIYKIFHMFTGKNVVINFKIIIILKNILKICY